MIFDNFGNLQNNDGTPINQPLNGALPDLSNEVVNPAMISGGKSKNFLTGKSGWEITDDGNCEFQSGIFRGDITGASGVFSGTISASNVTAGTLTGSTIKATGGTGADVWMSSANGDLEFYYGGAQKAGIGVDSSFNLIYGAATSHQFFDNSNNQLAVFKNDATANLLLIIGGISIATNGTAITWSSGRSIQENSSNLICNGDFRPSGDRSNSLGTYNRRWDTVYSHSLTTGDVIFIDKYCPICQKEFEEGDFLVNFLYKKDITNPDTPLNMTIPAHLDCAKEYRKIKQKDVSDFIDSKKVEHEEKQLVLSDAQTLVDAEYLKSCVSEIISK